MDNKDKRVLFVFSLVFAAVSFVISVSTMLVDKETEIRLQSIQWFGLAIICLAFPYILPLIKSINLPGGGDVQLKSHEQVATALQQIERYLFEDKEIDLADLQKELATKNQRAIETIYHYLDGWRTQQVFQIIKATTEDARLNVRKQLGKLEPILRLLINTRESNDPYLHNYYSRLAYVCKDMAEPKWKDALDKINLAIETAPTKSDMSFTVYKFNRLVCAINCYKKPNREQQLLMESDFHDCREELETLKMLTGTDEHIAPKLKGWLNTTDRQAYIKRAKERFVTNNQ